MADPLKGIEAVIFDWGGTLTPWHSIDPLDLWRAYSRVYDPSRAEALAEDLTAAGDRAWRRAEEHHGSGTLDDLLREAGVDLSAPSHGDAMRAYLQAWDPHTYLDPDALPLITALRQRNIRVGVLSNTLWPREHHEAVFARDGVLHLIDGAVYSSEIAYTKPHPGAFQAAMRAVGVAEPARVVFVGDRPIDDISGAKAVGMRAVLVPHSEVPSHDVEPDATIQRLADLLPLVRSWP
ncbi:MAG: HAD-IA family hydrolase [Pseudonocardiales bacterium]